MEHPLAIRFDKYRERCAAATNSGSSRSHLDLAQRGCGVGRSVPRAAAFGDVLRLLPLTTPAPGLAIADGAYGRLREAVPCANPRPQKSSAAGVRRHGSRSSLRHEIRGAERYGSRFRQVGALVW